MVHAIAKGYVPGIADAAGKDAPTRGRHTLAPGHPATKIIFPSESVWHVLTNPGMEMQCDLIQRGLRNI